ARAGTQVFGSQRRQLGRGRGAQRARAGRRRLDGSPACPAVGRDRAACRRSGRHPCAAGPARRLRADAGVEHASRQPRSTARPGQEEIEGTTLPRRAAPFRASASGGAALALILLWVSCSAAPAAQPRPESPTPSPTPQAACPIGKPLGSADVVAREIITDALGSYCAVSPSPDSPAMQLDEERFRLDALETWA